MAFHGFIVPLVGIRTSPNGIGNADKAILFETLTLVENKNIDFINALICAKGNLQGLGKLSFDHDLKTC